MYTKIWVLVLLCGICVALPPHSRRFADEHYEKIETENAPKTVDLSELGIEYARYLQEVIQTLEADSEFKKKLENADDNDIRTAKIADELEYVNHHVRSKLDELKRMEIQRLKELAEQAYGSSHKLSNKRHLNHNNPNKFEVKDLKMLIHKVAEDLAEADRKRKNVFKDYEMEKQFELHQKMINMTDEQREAFLLQEEKKLKKKKEMQKKEKIHHPGSKKQLEEVWETQDQMSGNDFNPRTFFVMHDLDGNEFLDEEELKVLFSKELDKLYQTGMPYADLIERAEEMERMREHVFNEVDLNKDRLISWEEFHYMSLRPEFSEDPGWEPIDQQKVYTPEELEAYEQQRLRELNMPPEQRKPVYGYPKPQAVKNNPEAEQKAQEKAPAPSVNQLKPGLDQPLPHAQIVQQQINKEGSNPQYQPEVRDQSAQNAPNIVAGHHAGINPGQYVANSANPQAPNNVIAEPETKNADKTASEQLPKPK